MDGFSSIFLSAGVTGTVMLYFMIGSFVYHSIHLINPQSNEATHTVPIADPIQSIRSISANVQPAKNPWGFSLISSDSIVSPDCVRSTNVSSSLLSGVIAALLGALSVVTREYWVP